MGASWYPQHRASFEGMVRVVVERREREKAGAVRGEYASPFRIRNVPDDVRACLAYIHRGKSVLVDTGGGERRERRPSRVAMVEAAVAMYLAELCSTEVYAEYEARWSDQLQGGPPSVAMRCDSYNWLSSGILTGTAGREYVHLPLDLADRLSDAAGVLHVAQPALVIGSLVYGLAHSELWVAAHQERFTAALRKFSRWLLLPGRAE